MNEKSGFPNGEPVQEKMKFVGASLVGAQNMKKIINDLVLGVDLCVNPIF